MGYLQAALNQTDICCIQEHWLFRAENKILVEADARKITFGRFIDDDNPELSMTAKRGYGGICIFWNTNIDSRIKTLPDGNCRIQAIQIDSGKKPVLVINVYMPSDNKEKDIEYKDTISQIEELLHKYGGTHDVVICGDWNGSLIRSRTTHDPLFQGFVERNNLHVKSDVENKNTFYHHNGKSTSQIDYILTNNSSIIGDNIIMDMLELNTSDHVPVTANLKIQLTRCNPKIKTALIKTKWDKCNKQEYKEAVAIGARNILQGSCNDIADDIKQLEKILHMACKETIPGYQKKCITKTKGNSIWNKEIAMASQNSKNIHRLWKMDGAPSKRDNPLKSQLMTAKTILRRAQRRAYASQRDAWARKIMEASPSDSSLFHKLIKKQRSDGTQTTKILKMGNKVAESSHDIMHMWEDHFRKLANPDPSQPFDYEKLELAKIQNEIIEKMQKGKSTIKPVHHKEISDAIKKLKSGKSADVDGITAEHYKFAEKELVSLIIHILNTILKNLDVPKFLKSGILTPVLKKKKDKQIPSNYRGITVTKIFTKILQTILKSRIDETIKLIQNPLQRGFTEGTPSLFAGFLASEVIAETKDEKTELQLLTLDAEKAFDIVHHEILFNKLYHNGIEGDMWLLLRNLYREMNIQIKWDNMLSQEIMVNQGIQQGAKLSTSLYKCYNNDILDSVAKSGLGKYIGDVCVATPTCADDILVLSNSKEDMQGVVDIINHHTSRDLVKINPDKSDLVCYNTKNGSEVKIGDTTLQNVEKTKHLGLIRNEDNTCNIEERIKTGRSVIYGLLGAGLHLRKGFSPVVALNLWKIYAVPRVTYGLEIMTVRGKDLEQLELMQRKILKQLQGLPSRTANTAVYILLGAMPIKMVIERNMLSLLISILRNRSSIEYQLLKRQQAMKKPKGNLFINRIESLLMKYEMDDINEIEKQLPSKYKWKNLVKAKQNKYWYDCCREDQENKSTLKYLNIQKEPLNEPHNIWQAVGNDLHNVKACEIKTKLATQTYMLQETRHKHNNRVSPLCTICKLENEDIEHFLLKCSGTANIRERHLQKINSYMDSISPGLYQHILKSNKMLNLLLDCTHPTVDIENRLKRRHHSAIEERCRKMCYDLHNYRTHTLKVE